MKIVWVIIAALALIFIVAIVVWLVRAVLAILYFHKLRKEADSLLYGMDRIRNLEKPITHLPDKEKAQGENLRGPQGGFVTSSKREAKGRNSRSDS